MAFLLRIRSLFLVLCIVVLWLLPSAALAQTPPSERPYRGLFGQTAGETEQSLTVNVSLGGGYDDDVFQDATDSADPSLSGSASYGHFSGGLVYSLHRGRIQLAASTDSSGRYYASHSNQLLFAHAANLAASLQIAEGTRLTVGESLAYQPLLALAAFPAFSDEPFGQRERLSLDAGLRRDEYLTHGTSVDLSQRVSRRGTITANYGFQTNRVSTDGALSTHSGAAGYSHSVSKSLRLRLGYGLSAARYPGATQTYRSHNLDVGVGFEKALGASRRTTVTFGSGATAVEDGIQTQYRAIGDAQLRREIGRTWNASAGYNRAVQYVETFRAPVFADGLSFGVGGEVNRRVQFHSQLSAAIANLAFSGGNSGFTTYSATTGLVFGLSRFVAVGVDYALFRYAFQANASVPVGMPRQMTRHGVATSLSLWLPIVQTPRRADASR